MHPEMVWAIAADRIRDWHRQAAEDRLARLARRHAHAPSPWLRLARWFAAVLAECQRAQRRAAVLRAAPDRYLPAADQPPADYREFLARTAGPLLPEPPAARRARGHAAG